MATMGQVVLPPYLIMRLKSKKGRQLMRKSSMIVQSQASDREEKHLLDSRG
jgi:hypothetical protein